TLTQIVSRGRNTRNTGNIRNTMNTRNTVIGVGSQRIREFPGILHHFGVFSIATVFLVFLVFLVFHSVFQLFTSHHVTSTPSVHAITFLCHSPRNSARSLLLPPAFRCCFSQPRRSIFR